MLFWEALHSKNGNGCNPSAAGVQVARTSRRLPFDWRCAARTKSGGRCHGRVRKGTDFCPFHDPSVSAEQRRANAAKGARSRNRLARLPDGYLRKLDSRAAVAEAMDRLYREVRLGLLTPEMGRVLLEILTRIDATSLSNVAAAEKCTPSRAKINRLKPKLDDLLTRQERAAWRQAVAAVPEEPLYRVVVS